MYSYRLRLFIGLLVVAVLAVALVTLLTSRGISTRFMRYVAGNEDAEKRAIAAAIEQEIREVGPEGIAPLAGAIGDVTERPITLTDEQGDVIFSTEVIVEEISVGPGAGHAGGEASDLTLSLSGDSGAVRVVTTTERLVSPALGAGSFDNAEAAFLGETNLLIVITAVIALALAGIAALWLSRSYVRPIFAMTTAAERLAAGDLSQRVAVERRDELGRLALSFNAMAANLEDQERLRRTLVGDVAHELRTPLANVRGYLEAIQDGVVDPDDLTIASLHEETLLLSRLVEDLQILSLAEAGQIAYEIEPLDTAELLQSGARAMLPMADEKGISLTVRPANDPLPPVLADAERSGQVLRNLLINALTYTPQGGEVVISAEPVDGAVVISVSDSGPGVEQEHEAYLFERFYRADASRERDTGGSGLGLAISKAYVEGQNGRIWIDTHAGDGATFTFTLPLALTSGNDG